MSPEGSRISRYLPLLAAALLASCAAPPKVTDVAPEEVKAAIEAERSGRHEQAAKLWEDAARSTAGAERESNWLRAAESWSNAGQAIRAEVLLGRIDERLLPATERSLFALLQAESAMRKADPEMADFYLGAAAGKLTPSQLARYSELSSQLRRMRASPARFALSGAEAVIAETTPYDTEKGLRILRALEDVPSRILADAENSGIALQDWPALALQIRRSLVTGAELRSAGAAWMKTYPGHTVSGERFEALAQAYRDTFTTPANIAVLLPTEGSLETASAAIRDGLISAYLRNPGVATMRFYSTGPDPESAVTAYRQAVSDGADWIIGPLRRESVQALAGLDNLMVPVLVLNELDDSLRTAGKRLFTLSLSQEEEARAIARKSTELGYKRAITLVANNAWGKRMETAFSGEFTELEGEVVTGAIFSTSASDHGTLLTRMLEIDASEYRKDRLQATLGLSLVFEPIRRDDFDFFFLAAGPEQGRQIRPQLRFHNAGDKPVFAMGRIFSGQLDSNADRDLNGITFASSDWRRWLEAGEQAPEFTSLRGGSMSNLFALGTDTWNLLHWLPMLERDPDLQIPGATGALGLAHDGRIIRTPSWSTFSAGRPVPARWPAPGN